MTTIKDLIDNGEELEEEVKEAAEQERRKASKYGDKL